MGVLEKAALDVPGRMLTPKSSAFAPPLVFKALSLLPSLRALNGGGVPGEGWGAGAVWRHRWVPLRAPVGVGGDSGGVTVRSLLEILNNQLANGKVQSDQQHSQPHMSCLRPALSCQLAWGASAFHYWKYAINRRGKKSQI